MKRKSIRIDREKCNGCGLCAKACHEGAIEMREGKAVLAREDYCDGLGDCLPVCPTNAISFAEQETTVPKTPVALPSKKLFTCPRKVTKRIERKTQAFTSALPNPSCLGQWPCQIKLIPPNAPYFHEADLLIAADCAAYAYGNFHSDFMKGRITLIGCPKLDSDDTVKLATVFKENKIRSITLVRMEVPCCSGLEEVVKRALQKAGKEIPLHITIIGTNGQII